TCLLHIDATAPLLLFSYHSTLHISFFLTIRLRPRSTLFPYTTLFRSRCRQCNPASPSGRWEWPGLSEPVHPVVVAVDNRAGCSGRISDQGGPDPTTAACRP